jgi:hypothetical protein
VIIGGGPSLRSFDFDLIKGFRTIGVNDAFLLGAEYCNVCFFGDRMWWDHHIIASRKKIMDYPGAFITNAPFLPKNPYPPFVRQTRRENDGWWVDNNLRIAWNRQSGAAAIHLAWLLGATGVILLGYDMGLSKDGRSNWHPNEVSVNKESVYTSFAEGLLNMKRAMESKGVDMPIVNANPDSKLELWPRMPFKEATEYVAEQLRLRPAGWVPVRPTRYIDHPM